MNITSPIVVDLGKTRNETITQLRSGRGQLAEDVQEVMRRVRSSAGPERPGRIFVPVIVIHKRAQADQDETAAEAWQHDSGRTGK